MFKVSKNKSSVSWRHFSSHCGSSFLSVKLTVKIENISFIPVEIFHTELNSLNDQIRFTINRSKIEIPFLDVLIRISTNNNIITDIFSKDTDTHMYLNFRSSHPKHIKINIPFNLASRIITITNTEELRDTRLRELRLYLKNQQYPEEIVEHGIQKALEKGPIHTELREQVHVTSNQNNIIPFVTTYRDYNIFHFMKLYKILSFA
jgi:hypothetical protein